MMADRCLFPFFLRQGKSRTRCKVGYMDRDGRTVIDPVFSDGTGFSEGFAAVKVGKSWGVIDVTGSFVIPANLPDFCYFHDGLARLSMKKGKEWKSAVIDPTGKVVVPPVYDYVGRFIDGLALIRIGECAESRFGFINKTGQEVIPPKFHGAQEFSEGLAAARVANLWGYIARSGVFKIMPRFEATRQGLRSIEDTEAGKFSEGLAPAWSGKAYGFIDSNGEFVVAPDFDKANSFREKRALIQQQNRFGFLDRSGNIAVTPHFTRARDFSEGLAMVGEKDWKQDDVPLCGFIDIDGNVVIKPKFWGGSRFRNGLCFVWTETSLGYINREGEFVWHGEYVECRIE